MATNYTTEEKSIIWFEYEPGDATRYEFGISIPASFFQGCNSSYVVVITKSGFYPFSIEDIFNLTEDSPFEYYAQKLHMDEYTAKTILLCISSYFKG